MGPHVKDEEGEFVIDKDGNKQKNYWHEMGWEKSYRGLNAIVRTEF